MALVEPEASVSVVKLGKVTVVAIALTIRWVCSGGVVTSVETASVKMNVVCCSGTLSSNGVSGYIQVVVKGGLSQ